MKNLKYSTKLPCEIDNGCGVDVRFLLTPLRGYLSIWDMDSAGSRPQLCAVAASRLFGLAFRSQSNAAEWVASCR